MESIPNYKDTQEFTFNLMSKILAEFKVTSEKDINGVIHTLVTNTRTFRDIVGEIKEQLIEFKKRQIATVPEKKKIESNDEKKLPDAIQDIDNKPLTKKVEKTTGQKTIDPMFNKNTKQTQEQRETPTISTPPVTASDTPTEEKKGSSYYVNMTNEALKKLDENLIHASVLYLQNLPAFLKSINLDPQELFNKRDFSEIISEYEKTLEEIKDQIVESMANKAQIATIFGAVFQFVLGKLNYDTKQINIIYKGVFGLPTSRFYIMRNKLVHRYPFLIQTAK